VVDDEHYARQSDRRQYDMVLRGKQSRRICREPYGDRDLLPGSGQVMRCSKIGHELLQIEAAVR
ncbi:MAG TPA: hypothetical protein VIK97_02180, partial [Casimicrobiaceae bacterium]